MSIQGLKTDMGGLELEWRGPYQSTDGSMYDTGSHHHAHAAPTHTTSYHFFPVTQWTNEHVLEWLKDVCQENNIDCDNLRGFVNCTGYQLCSLGLQQFGELHPLHGALFFRKLREYIDNQQRQERYQLHHYPHAHAQASPPPLHLIPGSMNGASFHDLLPRHSAGHGFPPWQDAAPPYQPEHFYPSEGAPPPTSEYVGGAGGQSMGGYQPAYPLHNEFESSAPHHHYPPLSPPHGYLPCPPSATQHGSSPSSPIPPTAASPPCFQQDARRDRGPKLWEFLLDLLEDPSSNPNIIRWENQEERTFRLTSPHEVALRWGQRRPSQNSLPYDYFARALRYHYKTGMLISVPERKLVYKFGHAVFQQRRRGGSSSPADTPPGHHPS